MSKSKKPPVEPLKHKLKIIGLTIAAILLVLFLAPIPWTYSQFDPDCEYCQNSEKDINKYLTCQSIPGGCFEGCVGFNHKTNCTSDKYQCNHKCDATCFGLMLNNCGLTLFERKINYYFGR